MKRLLAFALALFTTAAHANHARIVGFYSDITPTEYAFVDVYQESTGQYWARIWFSPQMVRDIPNAIADGVNVVCNHDSTSDAQNCAPFAALPGGRTLYLGRTASGYIAGGAGAGADDRVQLAPFPMGPIPNDYRPGYCDLTDDEGNLVNTKADGVTSICD